MKDPEKTPLKKALAIFLIVGFLLVDFLFFHDLLKPGETITFAQYLTGAFSVPVMVLAAPIPGRGQQGHAGHPPVAADRAFGRSPEGTGSARGCLVSLLCSPLSRFHGRLGPLLFSLRQ